MKIHLDTDFGGDIDVDWYVQSDVAAARQLLEAYAPTIIPVEITLQTSLRRSYLPRLRQANPLGALIARQAEAFACAVAIGWDGVKIETLPLRPEVNDAGYLRAAVAADGKPTRVVTEVDAARFGEWWCEALTR